MHNEKRPVDEQVPKAAIFSKKKELIFPSMDEGFESLHFVKIDNSGNFLVEAWKNEV